MIESFSKENRFLSNFWPAKFTFEGLNFESVEHAYQSLKFKDELFHQAYALTNPYDIKAFANANKHNVIPEFHIVKTRLMYLLVKEKFIQNPELGNKLLETGNQELVEGNTWGDLQGS
jgi:ribA/ribD-fused uncharacterized protein